MINKKQIDLYLSQIKTDDPNLQRLIKCMGIDLKNIIDEYDKAMKIIEDTKDSNVVLERNNLKSENIMLKRTINGLQLDLQDGFMKLAETKRKLNMARQMLRDSKDFRKLERTIQRYFEVF